MKTNKQHKRIQDNFGWVPLILGIASAIGGFACLIEVQNVDLYENPGKHIGLEIFGGLLGIASLIFLAMILINIGTMKLDIFLYNRKMRRERAQYPSAKEAQSNSLPC